MMHSIFLHNDNKHSFKYVSACLMEVLHHNPLQAEQCCLIASNVGKVHVKRGDYLDMYEYLKLLKKRELKVHIKSEEYGA